MRLLYAGLLIAIFTVFSNSAFSMTGEEFEKCILGKAQEHGGNSWLETVKSTFEDAYAVQVSQIQDSVAAQLGATLQGYQAPSISKTKTRDGRESTTLTISLAKFNPMKWLEPNAKRKNILEVCTKYFQDLAQFCADAYEKKEANINEWLAQHKGKIEEMTRRYAEDPKAKVSDVLGSYNFKTDAVTAGNMMYANRAFLPPNEIDPYAFGEYGEPIRERIVVDGNNIPRGLIMNVKIDGRPERYFAPFSGPGTLTNPYYFVFGGVPSSAWNRYWEQKYSGLNVNGQPLSSL